MNLDQYRGGATPVIQGSDEKQKCGALVSGLSASEDKDSFWGEGVAIIKLK